MLTPFDDYLIHQTAEPLAHPATGDRNHYDRFWFNGYARDASLYFGIALGLYPNRGVMDAAVSVVRDGEQISLHASRRAPLERTPMRVGPIQIEVVEPMQSFRVRVAAVEGGPRGELLFRARTPALEEPRLVHQRAGRVVMDSTRFTQWGRWEGRLELDGATLELSPEQILGTRDRSWGIRPVGEREAGPPDPSPQFFFLWSPIHFDDCCAHFQVNEDAEGRCWHSSGALVPADGREGEPERMLRVAHRVDWQPGTRRSRGAELTLERLSGESIEIALRPLLTAQMLGLGYLHPEWGHGLWKGEEAYAVERWRLDELAPLDPRHLHVQQLCRARMGEREGLGILEQLAIGPHARYGFQSLLDGAA